MDTYKWIPQEVAYCAYIAGITRYIACINAINKCGVWGTHCGVHDNTIK